MIAENCTFRTALLAAAAGLCFAPAAHATFHLMQIHQVIGGVGGDTSAQAIQLRMRSVFPQNEITGSRIFVYDAAGLNPVEIITFPNDVASGQQCRTVLVTTEQMGDYAEGTFAPDFIMTNRIPDSYLPAGSLTFENPAALGGGVLWRVSWGGASYTGPGTGVMPNPNDADAQFNPAWGPALPSTTDQALMFEGACSAPSMFSQQDYSLTDGRATFTNNAQQSFTVNLPDGVLGDLDGNMIVNGIDLGILLGNWSIPAGSPGCDGAPKCPADLDENGVVDGIDLGILLGNWTL